MFNIWVDYPTYEEEVAVVKATTSDAQPIVEPVLSAEEILHYQGLVRRIPVPDNVLEYAVKLVSRTRPGTPAAPAVINDHVSWGAGPRASQYLVVGAKAHALAHGRFSPDIADVQAVATSILRHRLVRNYKAEAEGVSIERLVKEIL
jgi:MoxR-like ATPase